jgi:hypothetical protein
MFAAMGTPDIAPRDARILSAPVALLLVASGTLASAACWYDSTWGQAKAAQQRYAAQATPSAIAASDESLPGAPKHTFRIRLRPNAHYLSQTVDAARQLEVLVEDADRVTRAALGLHLEVDETEPWSLESDESLESALAALRRDDQGDGVDVVVGLIGALPRPTDSLHEIGYAEFLGKHMVVRAASRLGAHDAVDKALTELGADERDRLVRSRRRHRAEAVFLHELGHILGALHEADASSLMHPAYDEKMSSFGDDAVLLMRLALDEGDHTAVARAQLDYLRNAKTTAWAAGERDIALKYLEAMVAPPPAAPAAAASNEAPITVPFDLHGPDAERFTRATAMLEAGKVKPAYEIAKPLFTAYPNSVPVQELRCNLAAVRFLDKADMLAECAPSVRLADAGGGTQR